MFDIEKFDTVNFKFPTQKISVPDLKEFFPENEDAVWEVRGLTGHELAIVNEAVETMNKTKAVIESIAEGTAEALKKGLKTLLNKTEEITPEDLARRLKMLEFGSINPVCPEHIAVKLANYKPTTFYKITNRIINLTGDGASVGE